MSFKSKFLVCVLATAFGAGTAEAQNLCKQYAAKGQLDAATITACTKEINSKSYTGNELAFLYYVRAATRYVKKEYSLALSDAGKAMKLNPSLSDNATSIMTSSYIARGIIHEQRKEYRLAIADITGAINLSPSLGQGYCYRSDAYQKAGDSAKSQADHNRALHLGWVCRPGAAAAVDSCALDLISQQYANAVRQCTDDIKSGSYHGKDIEVKYVNRGESYLADKTKGLTYDDSLSNAIADFTKAIELNPSDARAYAERGLAHSKTYAYKGGEKEYHLAVLDFSQAIQLNPTNAAVYHARGSIYLERTLSRLSAKALHTYYALALSDFNRVIYLSPDDAYAYDDRGKVYDDMADNEANLKRSDASTYYDKAISDFTHGIDLNPSAADIYCDRGYAYEGEGKADKAAADHAKARHLGDYMCDE